MIRKAFWRSLALLLTSTSALAAPVVYEIEYRVAYLMTAENSPPIDPRVQVGESYFGSFTVDDSILATDGINKVGSVSSFTIVFEDVVWSMTEPSPLSEFVGFRGPNGFGAAPGFDVVNGQLANLRGGVYGGADIPFVDFSTDQSGNYPIDPNCSGAYCGNSPNSFYSYSRLGAFGGSMYLKLDGVLLPGTNSYVPEPGTSSLTFLALAVAATVARRRQLRNPLLASTDRRIKRNLLRAER